MRLTFFSSALECPLLKGQGSHETMRHRLAMQIRDPRAGEVHQRHEVLSAMRPLRVEFGSDLVDERQVVDANHKGTT